MSERTGTSQVTQHINFARHDVMQCHNVHLLVDDGTRNLADTLWQLHMEGEKRKGRVKVFVDHGIFVCEHDELHV